MLPVHTKIMFVLFMDKQIFSAIDPRWHPGHLSAAILRSDYSTAQMPYNAHAFARRAKRFRKTNALAH